ncbi:MAG: type IV secretory system conjugative DNA transfer family protein [Pseudomonadota bacterium]
MAYPFGEGDDRFNSARFSTRSEIKEAGYFEKTPTSVFAGFHGRRPLWYDGDGGIIMEAGARAGKLRDILAFLLCSGIHEGGSLAVFDPKGELAAISQNQTPDGKHCRYWNPLGLFGFPQDKVNPFGHLTRSSFSLISDLKTSVSALIPSSGAAQALYFELNARRYLEAVALILILLNGELTLPDLYHAALHLVAGGDEWLNLAYAMYRSDIPMVRSVEAEIAAARADSSGGFRGILGEILKALQCLSDPVLLESVSPPFDFTLADLCAAEPLMQFYMMCPAELIPAWAPVIKAMFTGIMIEKARRPDAPTLTCLMDECGQFGIEGGFDLVPRLFSYGAGIGLRPFAVFQQAAQMDGLGKNARKIITSSAGLQLRFGLRELDGARTASETIGQEILDHDSLLSRRQADLARRQAFRSVLDGEDPFEIAKRLEPQIYENVFKSQFRRPVLAPETILNMPDNRLLIFGDGLPGPIYANRKPYWKVRWMAGRYHPNPYHGRQDQVQIQTFWGKRMRPVITRPVPLRFANYPQYARGTWSFIGK